MAMLAAKLKKRRKWMRGSITSGQRMQMATIST